MSSETVVILTHFIFSAVQWDIHYNIVSNWGTDRKKSECYVWFEYVYIKPWPSDRISLQRQCVKRSQLTL